MVEKDGPYRGGPEWPDYDRDRAQRLGDDGKLELAPWEEELLRQGELRAEREAIEGLNAKIASASGTEEELSARDVADLQALEDAFTGERIVIVDRMSVGIASSKEERLTAVAVSLHDKDGTTYTRLLGPFDAMRLARSILQTTERVLEEMPLDAPDSLPDAGRDSFDEQRDTDE